MWRLDLYMQNSIPHKHKSAVGYQIFGFEMEGQEHIAAASIVSPLALSSRILTTDSFLDLLILIVSSNQKSEVDLNAMSLGEKKENPII